MRMLLAILAAACVACSGLGRLDYGSIGSRDGWQRPRDVVLALDLPAGARVADLGSGNGYFLPFLASAVGHQGRVYAVEIDSVALENLSDIVARKGLDRVRVVEGTPEDSGLAEASVDLVLVVNTVHHIQNRPAYFQRLRRVLAPGARVAIIDPDEQLRGVLRLFLDEGHSSRVEELREEMRQAGYRHLASHDFLPIQRFEVFGLAPDA